MTFIQVLMATSISENNKTIEEEIAIKGLIYGIAEVYGLNDKKVKSK